MGIAFKPRSLHEPIYQCQENTPLLPEPGLPLSYSQRLFSPTLAPLPAVGLGVLGTPKILSCFPPPLGRKGDDNAKLCLLAPATPPTAFCHSGLAPGENDGLPLAFIPGALPFLDRGLSAPEPLPLLALPIVLLTLRGVAERGYRGGVTYVVPGLVGGVAYGSRPSRERCDGVSGMSDMLSVLRKRGERAETILNRKRRGMAYVQRVWTERESHGQAPKVEVRGESTQDWRV